MLQQESAYRFARKYMYYGITFVVAIVNGRRPRRLHSWRHCRRHPWPRLVGIPEPSRPMALHHCRSPTVDRDHHPTRPRWPAHNVTSTAVKTTTTRPVACTGHLRTRRPSRGRAPSSTPRPTISVPQTVMAGRRRCLPPGRQRTATVRTSWSQTRPLVPAATQLCWWAPSGTQSRTRSSNSPAPMGTAASYQTTMCAHDTRPIKIRNYNNIINI